MLRARWVLGILILLTTLILGVVLWRHIQSRPIQELLDTMPQHIDLALDQLNYTQTENGIKRWTLKSERAEYLRDNQLVNLTGVDLLFFNAGDAGDVTLRADRGQLQEETRQIDVQGGVVVTTSGDDVLNTAALHYDDQQQLLSTDQPFQYRNPQMTLEGIGLRLDLGKNTMFVEKNVTMRLFPNAGRSGEH